VTRPGWGYLLSPETCALKNPANSVPREEGDWSGSPRTRRKNIKLWRGKRVKLSNKKFGSKRPQMIPPFFQDAEQNDHRSEGDGKLLRKKIGPKKEQHSVTNEDSSTRNVRGERDIKRKARNERGVRPKDIISGGKKKERA